ncbi:MAG TPA: carboxypeptidase-like regulatory domain-containing protein, partial [Bryobacteraceae bacterium]|nr:carboxypeptidase-like regulatory domain-containing protein [Bryobacteraceae bacterium]
MATAQTPAAGAVEGTVTDGAGAAVAGAIVTLESPPSAAPRTAVTDQSGEFHFSDVAPGKYKVTVAANGFSAWSADVTEPPGGSPAPLAAKLQVTPVSSVVDVLPPHVLAAEQLKAEEKQRVLAVIPHYLVTYDPNAAPLSAGQKFQLG